MSIRYVPAVVTLLATGVLLGGCVSVDTGTAEGEESISATEQPSDDSTSSAEPSQSITLGVPATEDARCVAPTPEFLDGIADQAFEATVESVVDDTVTLTPTRWYRGDEIAEVNVEAPSPELQEVLLGVDFVEGERYLVASADENLVLCGMTARWTAELEKTYVEAFAD